MQTSSRGNARLNEYHPAFEEYCETIFELREDDVAVIQARIAERLDVSRPAVSEMVHKMADEGLLTVARAKISLTEEGTKLAERAETLTASMVDLILDDEGADYFGH